MGRPGERSPHRARPEGTRLTGGWFPNIRGLRLVRRALHPARTPAASGLLRALGAILGLLQDDPAAFLQAGARVAGDEIDALVAQRSAAKAARNFGEADRIRQELLARGIVLKDSPTGTTWEVQA